MSDYSFGWQCLYCNSPDYNALALDRCANCNEQRPPNVRIQDVPKGLAPMNGKAPKNAPKGRKEAKTKASKKEAKERKVSSLEWQFETLWRETGLPMPTPEYKFLPTRRFRFDFCFEKEKVAIELEGGTWGKSRHTSGRGYEKDCEKYNLATLAGFKVLRFTKVNTDTIKLVETLYKQENAA